MAHCKYTHLTESDMIRIETLIEEGYSYTEIGIRIGKHRTTVSRCIQNHSERSGEFSGEKAWEIVSERKSSANAHYKIVDDSVMSKYILEKIVIDWSPEQIAAKWSNVSGDSLSKDTIYKWIYENHPHLVKLHFRRKGKKYIHRRKEKYKILDRRMIDERPEEVEERLEVGHWEGDTIIGKNHKGAIVTNVERKTGFLIASLIERRTAEKVSEVTIQDFKNLPDELRVSMTYDNGREFAWHQVIEGNTQMTVYFAHPYTPWERGSNENTNGLLRQYIPKGSSFDNITQQDLDHYVQLINNRPRKRLGFLSPKELLQKELNSCTST